MTMLQLAGPPAATAFRLKKLRAELRALAPSVTDVTVFFEHYVSLAGDLTEAEERVLRALLNYGDGPIAPQDGRQHIYVVPRLGTISPWASKATDINRDSINTYLKEQGITAVAMISIDGDWSALRAKRIEL